MWVLLALAAAEPRREGLVVDGGRVKTVPDFREPEGFERMREAPAPEGPETSLAEQLLQESAAEFPLDFAEIREVTTPAPRLVPTSLVEEARVTSEKLVDLLPPSKPLEHGTQCGWPGLCHSGYAAPFVAVLITVTSAVCMKRAEGFAQPGWAAAAAVLVSLAVVANTAMPQSSWAYSRAAERLGVAGSAAFVLGDTMTPWRAAAVVLGALGALYLEVGEALSSHERVDAELLQMAVVAADVFALTALGLLVTCVCMSPQRRARVTPSAVKYVSLGVAIGFAVVRTVLLVHSPQRPQHCLIARVLCGWASSAGLIVLLDFLDLGPGWALVSHFDALASMSLAYATGAAEPHLQDAVASGLLLSSVAFFLCEASVYERLLPLEGKAHWTPRLSREVDPYIRKRLLAPEDE